MKHLQDYITYYISLNIFDRQIVLFDLFSDKLKGMAKKLQDILFRYILGIFRYSLYQQPLSGKILSINAIFPFIEN